MGGECRFWTMWLFTIPSLRAVKPLGYPQWDISSAQAPPPAPPPDFVGIALLSVAVVGDLTSHPLAGEEGAQPGVCPHAAHHNCAALCDQRPEVFPRPARCGPCQTCAACADDETYISPAASYLTPISPRWLLATRTTSQRQGPPSWVLDASLCPTGCIQVLFLPVLTPPLVQGPGEDSDPGVEVKGLLKYLDYGTGKERGARK